MHWLHKKPDDRYPVLSKGAYGRALLCMAPPPSHFFAWTRNYLRAVLPIFRSLWGVLDGDPTLLIRRQSCLNHHVPIRCVRERSLLVLFLTRRGEPNLTSFNSPISVDSTVCIHIDESSARTAQFWTLSASDIHTQAISIYRPPERGNRLLKENWSK